MMSSPLFEPESGYPCAATGPIEVRIVSQTDIIIISVLIAQLQEQREKISPEEVVSQHNDKIRIPNSKASTAT